MHLRHKIWSCIQLGYLHVTFRYQSDEVWNQIQLLLLFSNITPMSIQNKDLNEGCLKKKIIIIKMG